MTISKTQIRQIIDVTFGAIEKMEGSHALLVLVTGYVQKFADGAGVDAIAEGLTRLGWTVTD